jgi:putative membrane protein
VNCNVTPDKLILRDCLAAERTRLANERTLLAYLRCALILFMAAITILKLFEGDHAMTWNAFFLGPLSIFTGINNGKVVYRKV